MSCDETADAEWLDARIEKTKTLIEAIEDAIAAVSVGGVQSYMLNTGQTQQQVTKANLGSMRLQLDSLENRLSTLQARRCGAVAQVRPGF